MSNLGTLKFLRDQYKRDLIRYEASRDYLGIKETKKKLKFLEKEIQEQEKKEPLRALFVCILNISLFDEC